MKKHLLVLGACFFVSSASAKNFEFVNKDGSMEAQICIAAAQSDSALQKEMSKVSSASTVPGRFRCNGLSLKEFAKRYKTSVGDVGEPESIKVYSFENKTGTVEAELCIASTRSKKDFKAIAAKHSFSYPKGVKKIRCNNYPIERFARKYGNKSFKI